jgi:hypothetical protein
MAQMQNIEQQSESQRLAMAPRFLGMKRRVDRKERRMAKDPRASAARTSTLRIKMKATR